MNAQLESNKIKQTIIQSLDTVGRDVNMEDKDIDLGIVRKGLRDFENDLADIRAFEKHFAKAEAIIILHDNLQKERQDLSENAYYLGESYLYFQEKIKNVTTEFESAKEVLKQIITQIEQLKETQYKEERKLDKVIIVLQKDLERAKKQQSYWASINKYGCVGIECLLKKVAEQATVEATKSGITDRLAILQRQFDDIEGKYKALFQQAEIEYHNVENRLERALNKAKNKNLEQKIIIDSEFNILFEQIDEFYETETEDFWKEKERLQNEISLFKVKKATTAAQVFRQAEIKDISAKIAILQEQIRENNSIVKSLDKDIKQFEKEAKSEKEKLERSLEFLQKEKVGQKQAKKEQIFGLNKKLESFEHSFYKFLNDNYKGWQTKFGKVCDENILFHTNLKPKLHEISTYFYGLTLDLSAVENKVKSMADYEKELQNLNKDLKQIDGELEKLNADFSEENTVLSRKYNKKINEAKKEKKRRKAENLQYQKKQESLEIDKLDAKQKAKSEKDKEIGEINLKLEELNNEILATTVKIDTQNERKKVAKKRLQNEKAAKILAIENILKRKEEETTVEKLKNKEKYDLEKTKLKNEKMAELSGKGADTKQIKQLEADLKKVKQKLRFIETIKKTTLQYEIEKKDIDKIIVWEKEKKDNEYELAILRAKHRGVLSNLSIQQQQQEQKCSDLEQMKGDINKDLDVYKSFLEIIKSLESYQEYQLEHDILQAKEPKKHDKLAVLKEKIENNIRQIGYNNRELVKKNNKYLSFFRDGNILNFKRSLATAEEHIEFANDLKSYIKNDKIIDAETGVNKQYASLLKSLRQDIDLLLARRKDIDSTIAAINRDFAKSIFVKAIEAFEMKTEDTANKIVQVLKEIKSFMEEHHHDISSISLFSNREKTEEAKKKSMRLLEKLSKSLGENQSQKGINLEDTFELKFRATQNGKATGWKDKLSDIGSHGTDILLKAMIYIMLLHVFKEKATRKSKNKDFRIHCIMDEIGRIHSKNIKGLIEFAKVRGIWMIFGSPEENDALAYEYVYHLEKQNHKTVATRLIYYARK